MAEFLAAYGLFAEAWSTSLLLAALLPLLGVVLLLRQQVFLGAAIAQSAGGGYAVALWLGLAGGGHGHAPAVLLAGWVAAVATALAVLRSLSRRGTDMEARAAVLFLLGGSGSMVLLAGDPHGMHEVQRLFLSSLLGADRTDVAVAAVLLVGSLAGAAVVGRRVALWAIDPATAAALGLRVGRFDLLVGLWLGTVLAFAIHTGGLLFAFGAAVLPVLLARELCRSLLAVAVSAPLFGLATAFAGLVLAHLGDRPPGQAMVAVQGAMLLLARAGVLLRRRRAGAGASAT